MYCSFRAAQVNIFREISLMRHSGPHRFGTVAERHMKRIFTFLAMAAILVSTTSLAVAQAAGPVGGSLKVKKQPAGRNGDLQFLQTLGLTKDQMAKIRDLKKGMADDNKAFRQAHIGDLPALRAHQKDSLAKYMTGLQAILTPDQNIKYQQRVSARKQLKLNADLRALQSLGLTPDTMAKVRELKAIEAGSVNQYIDKNVADATGIQSKISQAHQDYLVGLQKLLTPDQWQKYQASAVR